jgi:hypothetical protein
MRNRFLALPAFALFVALVAAACQPPTTPPDREPPTTDPRKAVNAIAPMARIAADYCPIWSAVYGRYCDA